MKENRYSIAPSKANMNKNQPSNIKGQYHSNPVNLNDSKTRRSTHNMVSHRNATFSSINKSSDPRPVKDIHFQEECIKKIIDFLIKQAYDRTLTKKDLMSPQAKDFINLFIFILSKIRPDWQITINKLDEDVIPILNELRYPGYINKTQLIAVGAPNTWPHLLAVLSWLVELADYLYYDSVLEQEEEKNSQNERDQNFIDAHVSSSVNAEKNFEKNYRDFLYDGYKQTMCKGDNFVALEALQNKVDDMLKINYSNVDKMITDTKNLEKLSEDLEKNNPSFIETQLSLDRANSELNTTKTNANNNEKKLNEVSNLLENKIKIYESKCEKNKEIIKMNEELEGIIKTQKVSFDDFEKLKHNKNQLEKQIQALNQKKTELENIVWGTNNTIDSMSVSINIKIKNIKQVGDKLCLNSEINLIDIGGCVRNISNLNLTDINSNFNTVNSQLACMIETKIKETKEKEELLINLKSELLKVDDKINETNEQLAHEELENERINNTLILEKEKYSQMCIQKNEEIKKMNENCHRSFNSISDKEKELEEGKCMESILDSKYQEEEDMTDRFIKELENEYVETFKQAEATKVQNISEIRKTQKSLLKIFENIKNKINE
jgi:SMC interacting uncharacterized protein involved in chromosome segregation